MLTYYVPKYKYSKQVNFINYGDNLQSLGIECFLQNKASISKRQIYGIVRDDMGLHDDERKKGILIVATGGLAWNFFPERRDFPINDHNLELLFFGARIPEGCFDIISRDKAALDMFLKHAPIGCRDASTRDFLRQMGVSAYLSGCATILFQGIDKSRKKGKSVYIIEDDDKYPHLQEILPSHIWDGHIRMAGNGPPFFRPMTDEDCAHVDRVALQRLETLCDDARLVITSRIHVAIPSAALGLPTVFIDKHPNDARSSIARMLLPAYTYKQLADLDFNRIERSNFTQKKTETETLLMYRLAELEKKLGYDFARMRELESASADALLTKKCSEEAPINSYQSLSYSPDSILDRLLLSHRCALEKNKRKFIIFGAGEFGRRLFSILKMSNITPDYFLDSCPHKVEGSSFCGLPIRDLVYLRKNYSDELIILASPRSEKKMLHGLLLAGISESNTLSTVSFYHVYGEYVPYSLIHD